MSQLSRLPAGTTVAIIGAGPLGLRLALCAAQAGFSVALEDVMPANLRHAEEMLRTVLGEAMLGLADRSDGRHPVVFARTVEQAVREADLAIDCVPDELESKLEIFSLMDRMAPPRTIFATPTRHLSIADLASCTYRPDRCVAMAVDASQFDQYLDAKLPSSHNRRIPVRITSQTSPETQQLVSDFWLRLGYLASVELDVAEPLLR